MNYWRTSLRTLIEILSAILDVITLNGREIAELDRKLTEQVNHIIHHADFQKLEGTWRGLHYLVNNTETDETLKIRVLNS